MEDIARKKPTFSLHAQVINEVSPGKLYLRAGQLDEATDRDARGRDLRPGRPDAAAHHLRRQRDHGADARRRSRAHTVRRVDGRGPEDQSGRAAAALLHRESHPRSRGRQHAHPVDQRHVQERTRRCRSARCRRSSPTQSAIRRPARQEIEHSLVNGVRIATTGTSGPAPPPPGTPGTRSGRMESRTRVLRLHSWAFLGAARSTAAAMVAAAAPAAAASSGGRTAGRAAGRAAGAGASAGQRAGKPPVRGPPPVTRRRRPAHNARPSRPAARLARPRVRSGTGRAPAPAPLPGLRHRAPRCP